MRLPRLHDAELLMDTFNRLAADLERVIRPIETGTATLTLGTTSTTVANRAVRVGSAILISAADSDAAAGPDWYVAQTDVGQGSFVIRHASDAADRLIRYLIA